MAEMDMKDKLVELLNNSFAEQYKKRGLLTAPHTADDLIAHGVTVQEWISVKDKLPEQGQEVIVYSGGVLKPTVFAYQFWNKNYDSWARITHWMPMPKPPKGE